MIGMCCFHSLSNLNGDTNGFFYFKLSFTFNEFLEGNAFDKFHYNIMKSVIISNIINIYNVWMRQTCC